MRAHEEETAAPFAPGKNSHSDRERLLVANYQLEFPFFYFMGAFAGRKIAVVWG